MKQIDYLLSKSPDYGAVTPITDWLYMIRMPLPFALNHVNIWVLKNEHGFDIIDFGINRDEPQQIWKSLLANELKGKITKMLATHFHPDHVGNAGFLMNHLGYKPDFYMSQTEWLFARMISIDPDEYYNHRFKEYYTQFGLDQNIILEQTTSGNGYARNVTQIPLPYNRLQAGDRIILGDREWRVMIGEGHAPEHISLYCEAEKILIAGDQILPKISPNVSIWPHEPDANNLKAYLDSLPQFVPLPHETLVLPSHGLPFRGLHARIDQLQCHHDERLDHIKSICASSKSAYDIMQEIFPIALDKQQIFFAVGETIAHLNYLVETKALLKTKKEGAEKYTSN